MYLWQWSLKAKVFMANVLMASVIMTNVFMTSVIMANVFMGKVLLQLKPSHNRGRVQFFFRSRGGGSRRTRMEGPKIVILID